MPLHFKGIAHPPAMRGGKRGHAADFTDTEISVTNLGRRGGTNLLYEHNPRDQVGQVTSSWQGVNGELRVSGVVHDTETIKKIRSGHSRGLSLGTSVLSGEDDKRISSSQDELSLCVEPRRAGCWVDEINGKQVRTVHRASAGTRQPDPSSPLIR